MSLGKILGLAARGVTNFTKRGVVATADVAAKKVNIPGWNITNLVKSPAADEFLKRTGKQNAKILSDNIVRFNNGTMPFRVITKRLPSGTTIAQGFGPSGDKTFKEVISKNVTAYSSYNGNNKAAALVKNFKKGVTIEKPVSYSSYKSIIPSLTLDNPAFRQAEGLTRFANSNNKNYAALLEMGLVK